MPYSLTAKYQHAHGSPTFGVKESGCGCNPNLDKTVYPVDEQLLLVYVGMVAANINGYSVHPNTLALGLNPNDYDQLKSDPRFRIPSEVEKKTLYSYFGK